MKQVLYIGMVLLLSLLTACNHTTKNNNQGVTDSTSASAKTKAMTGYATVNGLKMYYEVHGAGEPLVLIHGGGSTIQTSFAKILPLFAANYKVIAVELQAHGHTADRDTASSFEQDADDVAALLLELKVDKANILGFSNGGSTALQIGIRHPQLVNKLVVISGMYKRSGLMEGFFNMMENASLKSMPMPLQTAYLAIPGNTQAGLQAMHDRDKNRMLQFKDWPDAAIHSIQAETLIINADKDVTTNAHAMEMAKLLSHASLMILPGVHGSCLGEVCTNVPGSYMPAFTAGIITEFLQAGTNPTKPWKKVPEYYPTDSAAGR